MVLTFQLTSSLHLITVYLLRFLFSLSLNLSPEFTQILFYLTVYSLPGTLLYKALFKKTL